MSEMIFGAIEAGGTKFICATGSGPARISERVRFPTTTPEETLGACISYFRERSRSEQLAGIGIACFGPLNLNPRSPHFGSIANTPKQGWKGCPIVRIISDALQLPVALDTDVNGAVLAEHRWGSAQELHNALYLTVGTGIGGGILVNGDLVHGLAHPEMGHIRVRRHPKDTFEGTCPFHRDCLEGLASGSAFKARWGVDVGDLPTDHLAYEMEAYYISEALSTYILTISPERIILGGGVMSRDVLFPMIRHKVAENLHGYIDSPALARDIDSYIVPQGLHGDAGVLGAIALIANRVR